MQKGYPTWKKVRLTLYYYPYTGILLVILNWGFQYLLAGWVLNANNMFEQKPLTLNSDDHE